MSPNQNSHSIGYRPNEKPPAAKDAATTKDKPTGKPKIVVVAKVVARLDDGREYKRTFIGNDEALEYAKELARVGLTLLGTTNVVIYPVHRVSRVRIEYEPIEVDLEREEEEQDDHEPADAVSETGLEEMGGEPLDDPDDYVGFGL
jgi:hypothetical protein